MKSTRCYTKRGATDCPIAVAYHANGRYLHTTPHWHPELEIAYIKKGRVDCLVDDQQMQLSSGDLLILSPGQAHLYLSPTKDAEILFFVFSLDAVALPQPHIFQSEFVQPLKDGALELPQKLDASHPAFAQAVERLDQPYITFINDPYYKINRYNAAINFCLALIPWCKCTQKVSSTRNSDSIPVSYAMQYIHNWYFKPLSLTWIASKTHLDPNYLSTLFHKKTGLTITQYLTKTRIEAAVVLLKNEDLSISRISELVGFRSESVFYQRFKEKMGVSPKVYQKMLRNQQT